MTRLPGGQLPVPGLHVSCMEPRTVGAHPLRLGLHTRSLEVPAVAGEKKGSSVPGRPWGGSGCAPGPRLAEMGKGDLVKLSTGPGRAARRPGVRRLGPVSWLGALPPRDWGGALGLSAVRQARGVQAWPGKPPSAQASYGRCEMGMIHVSAQ